MWTYIARRVLWAIPTLIGVSFVTFFIMGILPGDIAYNILGTAAQPEAVEALREELGLNDPVYVRYGRWLKDMATMDLGEAQVLSGRPIRELITSHFPVTLNLVIYAMVLSIVFGILLGAISAVYHDTWVDHVAKIISVIGLSVPVFFLAIVITLILATAFDYQADWTYVSPFKDPWGNIEMMFWPSVTLAYYLVAFTARMTRSSLLEVMLEDYMRTARAKGLRERVVVMRHGLRNAMIPVVTLGGVNFLALLGGLVLTERVYNLLGWGTLVWSGVFYRDAVMTQTLIFIFAAAVVVVNLLTDVMYAWLDPRIRYG